MYLNIPVERPINPMRTYAVAQIRPKMIHTNCTAAHTIPYLHMVNVHRHRSRPSHRQHYTLSSRHHWNICRFLQVALVTVSLYIWEHFIVCNWIIRCIMYRMCSAHSIQQQQQKKNVVDCIPFCHNPTKYNDKNT